MTEVRLALALLLFLLCFAAGREKARKLKQRTRSLGEFLAFARYLEVLIRVNAWTIPDGLENCADRFSGKWVGKLAGRLSKAYRGASTAGGLWGRALTALRGECDEAAALTDGDVQSIALFGDQLASSDIKSIGENYRLLYERTEQYMRESEQNSQIKGKLFRTIGTLAGLAAAITIA